MIKSKRELLAKTASGKWVSKIGKVIYETSNIDEAKRFNYFSYFIWKLFYWKKIRMSNVILMEANMKNIGE